MENIDFVYTYGMDESDLETRLREGAVGVLALASDGDAYAVPISYHYDDAEGRLFLRMSDASGTPGDKFAFAEGTATATFVVYHDDDAGSWSIVVRGTLAELSQSEMERFDPPRLNEAFDEFRVFGEDVDDVELRIFELTMREVTGRTTEP